VIASQYKRAFMLQLATTLDDFSRVRTIADQIAKHCEAIGPLPAGMRKARIKRRKIGMQIGEQCKFQAGLSEVIFGDGIRTVLIPPAALSRL